MVLSPASALFRSAAPSRSMAVARLLLLAVLAAAACTGGSRAPPPSPAQPVVAPDGGPVTSAPEQPPPAPPEPSAPGPMPVLSAQALVLDSAISLNRDQATTIDPAAHFVVEVQARVEDARLVLLDEQDAMVPVEGTTEHGATTRFSLKPSETLRAGSSYTLRLEGASRRETQDTNGRVFLPVIMPLRTTGERPPPTQMKRSKRVKKRHSGRN